MEAKLTVPQELIDEIAGKVIEKLIPLISNWKRVEDDKIFDKKRLAEYLSVSQSCINKMIVEKKIPYIKIGEGQSGGVRFSKKEIDKWVAKHSVPEINPFTQKSGKCLPIGRR